MRRIGLAVVLVVMFLAPLAEAQSAGKTARMGSLVFGPVESPEEQARRSTGLFWQAMKDLGLQIRNDDLVPKRLEFLKALVPNLSRVASLQEDAITTVVVPQMVALYQQQAAAAASTLGLKIHRVIVHRPDEFPAAFRDMTNTRDQGLMIFGTPFFGPHQVKEIVELAAKHSIVAIYENKFCVEAGGLMSYGGTFLERYRSAAALFDKILKGAKPGDLPVEQPTKFDLVINMKTAKALRTPVRLPPGLARLATSPAATRSPPTPTTTIGMVLVSSWRSLAKPALGANNTSGLRRTRSADSWSKHSG